MLKRLVHAIVGHSFRYTSSSFQVGSNIIRYGDTEDDFCKTWGFTQFVWACDCGHVKQFRAIGKHEGMSDADPEIAALRKMTGI